ncbi:MAG TPA: Pvc16 family protein [Chloroflexia bacterium]|nr:Pvc16 family protein [Chloroflexia bacterium]
MLHDLDETIKDMLVRGVPLDLSEIDISFEAPTSEWSASLARPTVNCYLYHLVENQELRQNQWEMDRVLGGRRNGTARHRMPFRVDACYYVTSWANEPEDEHRLLWRVLASLMRHSFLPKDCLQGTLTGQDWPMPTRVAQPEAPIKNPSDFWSSMEGPIRAGFNYIVTLPLDPERMFEIPLVLTRRVRARLLDDPGPAQELVTIQFGGWVRRGAGADSPGVAGAEVLLVERGLQATTDAAGRFGFDRVPRGRYTLRVTIDSEYAERTVDVPGEEYDLVLPAGAAPASMDRTPGAAPGAPSDASGSPPDAPPSGKSRRR